MAKQTNPIYERNGVLWVRFSHKGKQLRKSTGIRADEPNAVDRAYEFYLAIKKDLEDQAAGLIPNKTIADGMALWLQEYAAKLENPRNYKNHCRKIEPYIIGKPISQIYKAASTMKRAMVNEGLAPATINRRLSILKRIATLAHTEWNWLKESPHKKIVSLQEHNNREIALTPDEVQALADNCPDELAKQVILFAAYTGVRSAELWRITPNDLKGTDLKIKGKGHKSRMLPLKPAQVEFVKKYTPVSFSQGYIKTQFRVARDAAGLPDVMFHDLRHTFGTWLAQANVPLHKIMKLMGHTTVLMAQRYINMCVDDLRDDMPDMPERKKPKLKAIK